MTTEVNTFEEKTAGPVQQMINNPNASKVVREVAYGPHEIALTDDGAAIVNGEHVCLDMVEADGDIGD